MRRVTWSEILFDKGLNERKFLKVKNSLEANEDAQRDEQRQQRNRVAGNVKVDDQLAKLC